MRFSILSIFVTLFVLAISIMIGVAYFRYSQIVSLVALRLMHSNAREIYHNVKNELQNVAVETQFTAELINKGILNVKHQQDFIQYSLDTLRIQSFVLPSVQSIFWGDTEGNFTIIFRDHDDIVLSEMIDRKHRTTIHNVTDLNSQRPVLNNTTPLLDLNYDPRVRSWYVLAKQKKSHIWTDIFSYRLGGYLGFSSAVPVLNPDKKIDGVFGMSMRLDYVRGFIENQKISENGIIFIVNDQGEVIAYPHISQYKNVKLMNINDLSVSWVVQSYREYQKTNQKEFVFHHEGKKYLAVYYPVSVSMPHEWYIAVVAPENDFIGDLIKLNFVTLIIMVIILMIGVILMTRLVNRIVNPMKKLVKETEKIKNFELQHTGHVESRIKEVIALSDSIYSMKQGLYSFQKYVPAMLVRQLIKSGQDVLIGGEKKHLAIFFSDIQGFTEISEKMDPYHLMTHLCEYLTQVSRVISENGGTIDKYIGDSVMAFWGAPIAEEYPCQKAAQAALRCLKSLERLHAEWNKKGIPVFNTRIGLNYGEAIVGNLGSEERLNYTAIGDSINITSRLESANKIYGSKILVSDTFYQAIKDQFVFRYIDCIAVKGKVHAVNVYELLAEDKNELAFDVDAYQVEFAQGFACYKRQQWDQAILYFKQCQTIFPTDKLALVFINRCENYKQHPPEAGWEGVWHAHEK